MGTATATILDLQREGDPSTEITYRPTSSPHVGLDHTAAVVAMVSAATATITHAATMVDALMAP